MKAEAVRLDFDLLSHGHPSRSLLVSPPPQTACDLEGNPNSGRLVVGCVAPLGCSLFRQMEYISTNDNLSIRRVLGSNSIVMSKHSY